MYSCIYMSPSSRSPQPLCSALPHGKRNKLDKTDVIPTPNGRRLTIRPNKSISQYRCPPQMQGRAINNVYNKYLGCDLSMTEKERTKRYLRGVACLRDRLKTSSRYNHTNTGHAHAIELARKHIIQCQPSGKTPILNATNQVVSPSKFQGAKHNHRTFDFPHKRTLTGATPTDIITNDYYQRLVNHIARYNNLLKQLETELKTLKVCERI